MKQAVIYIVFLAVLHEALGCTFLPNSENSRKNNITNVLSCIDVPEASLLGQSTCSFRVYEAESLSLSGELATYNSLQLAENSTVEVVMTSPYIPIVDTITPNMDPEGVIRCVHNITGEISNIILIVYIAAENTQTPVFDQTSYTYNDVPETLDLYDDITMGGYGPPIYVTDLDSAEQSAHWTNVIYSELEDDFDVFLATQLPEPDFYPSKYRVIIGIIRNLDYNIQSSYQLTLSAQNADFDLNHTAIVNVTINLMDVDNRNPAFDSDEHTTNVTEAMLTTTGTYILPTDPPIHAYDQDLGINAFVTYDIDYDCGTSEECQILVDSFRIDTISGQLSFINTVGVWDHLFPQIRFKIKATQIDNALRRGWANVTAYFDLPPTSNTFPPSTTVETTTTVTTESPTTTVPTTTQIPDCTFFANSNNSEIDNITHVLYCKDVPEASELGESTCSFLVYGAQSVSLSGELATYNSITMDNGTIDLVMNSTYTPIVDNIRPTMEPEGVINCVHLSTSDTSNFILVVFIEAENTQTPVFDQPSYTYNNLPETWESDDFTTSGFGPPIYVTDLDSAEQSAHWTNVIYSELEDDYGIFIATQLPEPDFYPAKYRVLIALNAPLEYNNQSSYLLKLSAQNADFNLNRTATVNVTINLLDIDNKDPIFDSDEYVTNVTESMVTTTGTYDLTTVPPIHAYDQDMGINAIIAYDIDYNCGSTEECEIVLQSFRIDTISGELSFINNVGTWDHSLPQVRFEIKATQIDNLNRRTTANVTAYFHLP